MDAINEIIPKDKLVIPKESFQKFYKRFKRAGDILKTSEWEDVYSQFYVFDSFEEDIQVGETKEEMEAYNDTKQLEEFVKCAQSFPYFCHKYVKILHPIHGLIPCIIYKYQRRTIADYETYRFNILSKFRQGGLTTTAGLWGLWRSMFKTDQQLLLLSKSDREALAASEIVARALENLPNWLMPTMSTNSKHEKIFADTGSSVKFYTPEAARGKSTTILIVDEAAFIDNMDSHWKAMYPVISTGGSCIIISTVNGLGNWYEETYHGAEAKENKFHVIDLDYWEHPDYCNPEWVEDTKENLGDKGWAQEVLRSFLGSGDTYIPPHIIGELDEYTRHNAPMRILFDKWTNRQERKIDWDEGALWVWHEPIDGHEYLLAVDSAEGVGDGGDNSCLQVIDYHTLEQVCEFYSNSVPPNVLGQIIHRIGIFYNTALVIVENNAVGSAVASNLELGLCYENLYYETTTTKTPKVGVTTGTKNRPIYLECLQNRLLNGTVGINSRRFVNELKTFIYNSKSKKAEAQKGKHDDAVMALSIALHVRDMMIHDMPIGADPPKELGNIYSSEVFEEIRKEILRDAPEDWLEDEEEQPQDYLGQEDIMPGVVFDIRRKNDALLKEFGW